MYVIILQKRYIITSAFRSKLIFKGNNMQNDSIYKLGIISSSMLVKGDIAARSDVCPSNRKLRRHCRHH